MAGFTSTEKAFESVAEDQATVSSGLCILCRGSRLLCGKRSCPIMVKIYARQKAMPIVDMKDLAGSSPTGVFIGRYGYPKVDIGPLVPGEHGDTSVMDRPELWMGKSIKDIVDFRYRLVRGKYRIDAKNFRESGRIVDEVQSMSLAEKPMDVEMGLKSRPTGKIVLDGEVQPFGPSARMETMNVTNGRWIQSLEKGFYDTDMKAVDAVVQAYESGALISEIQKAFSTATMGIDRNRRFVPTRWSITAVDDIIGKNFLKETKWYPPIDDFRVYSWEQLDNRWAVVLMPTTWRFELIEAWYPDTSWNPLGNKVEIMHSSEFFKGRSEYAPIGGCYYASRMAVNELLEKEKRTAGAVICREAHPGYVMPVGVWNVRENVREALRHEPRHFDTLDHAFDFIEGMMDIDRKGWYHNSDVFTDYLKQRRVEDYYGHSSSGLSLEAGDLDGPEPESDPDMRLESGSKEVRCRVPVRLTRYPTLITTVCFRRVE